MRSDTTSKLPSRRADYKRRKPQLCLPDHERRQFQINVSLTREEVELLDRRRGRISRTGYLRGLLKPSSLPKQREVPEVNRQAYAELARLAANVNQLSKHLNETRAGLGQTQASVELARRLDTVQRLFVATHDALDGVRISLIGARSGP